MRVAGTFSQIDMPGGEFVTSFFFICPLYRGGLCPEVMQCMNGDTDPLAMVQRFHSLPCSVAALTTFDFLADQKLTHVNL